ncbi:Nucleotide-binding alpha-beta plait [Penicillium cinerascens]|uniref:Nucleotide-binding alpha-beta plait n=1 Tax=Penicillium cinerascens TaxID=70096 RepID=A0A9W9M724_9EURO|nr:Nucleotide-binding alpha-beta plait [Penicillium cinerascens]KAJ5191124.1 Nucleotide-binding alpha-beta plait [Penicillium cinerascens]
MAPDKREKKRKAPAVSDPPAKKTKKVEAKAAEATKSDAPKPILKKKENGAVKATKTKAAPKTDGESARQVKPRKRASDFLSDEENDEPAAPAPKKAANKKSKKEDTASAPVAKKAAAKVKKVEVPAESDEDDEEEVLSMPSESEEEIDDAEDDQTAALIKGFESSGDEDESGDEGFNPDKPVPKIPDTTKAQKKIAKQQKGNAPEEPGTVYIGRIPHGFYEHQMRAYFSQFGDITRLRLSRNRLTGRSKHYAFVEFSSVTVAKIVAETMDNYLMYSHILKCKYVPAEQLHPEVWKGANRRFKKTPWNRIEKKRLEKGKSREQWTKRIDQEQRKRQAKADKLKALGYEIDLPQLKSVDDVPVQEPKAIEASETPAEEPVKAVEAPVANEDTPKAKKGKKADKETPKPESAVESPAATKTTKKVKKATKTKA